MPDAPNRIAEIARTLYERRDDRSGGVVAELAEHAAAELPGAQFAGVTLTDHRFTIDTPAATHPCAVLLDDIQRRHGEGPCLASAWRDKVVTVGDLERERRWPRFRAAALAATDVRSIMGFQLFLTGRSMGALNVYAERPDAFDDRTRRLGLLFASHASVVWDAARREEQFQQALASRDVIGQAKGLIMERYGVDATRAFEMLRTMSHDSNVPLAQLAARVVETASGSIAR